MVNLIRETALLIVGIFVGAARSVFLQIYLNQFTRDPVEAIVNFIIGVALFVTFAYGLL